MTNVEKIVIGVGLIILGAAGFVAVKGHNDRAEQNADQKILDELTSNGFDKPVSL